MTSFYYNLAPILGHSLNITNQQLIHTQSIAN